MAFRFGFLLHAIGFDGGGIVLIGEYVWTPLVKDFFGGWGFCVVV
jgi:hypothetical protein